MMLTATLHSVDDAVMLPIPAPVLDTLGLAAGMEVALTIERGRLLVERLPKPKYSLAELLAHCDPVAPKSEQEDVWDAVEPAGRETL